MSANRDRRKQERARAAPTAEHSTSDRAAAAQAMIEKVATAAASAAANQISQPALAADTVRTLALTVLQRSTLHGRHECVSGCACCCHTAVTVAPPEVFAIARHVLETLPAEDLATLRLRLEENAARAASCTRDEYIAALVPCGLLTADGNCRAHPVRPLACAGFLSTSRAACEAEFSRKPNRPPVPTDRFAMLVCLGASHGLGRACSNAGLDGEFYELHHALRIVLDNPDAERSWSRGEPVFAHCLK